MKYCFYAVYLGLIILCTLFFTSCQKEKEIKKEQVYNEADSLINEAKDSIYTNITFASEKLNLAMSIAEDSLQIYRITSIRAFLYILSDKFDLAYIDLSKAKRFCLRQNLTDDVQALLASINKDFGNYYDRMGFIDSAMFYHKEALKDISGSNNPEAVSDYCINLADACFRNCDYANSAGYYREALFLSDSLNILDKNGFLIYFGLGEVYLGLRDFELSDTYFLLAEKDLDKRDLNGKFIFCNNRGNFYYFREDYAKALVWFMRARNLVIPENYKFMISLAELNLSDVYLHLDRLDSARYYADRSFDFFKSINHKTATYYLATIKAGIEMKGKKPAQAFRIMESCSDTSGIEVSMISIRNKYLEEYYTSTGNFKEAYSYLKSDLILTESVQSERIRNRIAELDLRYKQDTTLLRRNLLIREQQSRLRYLQQSKLLWLIICIITITGAVLLYLYMKKQRDLQRIKHFEQLSRLRMQDIRNRISPHFIFNVLNHKIINEESTNKNDELFELAGLIKQSLEITDNICIPLSGEIEFIKRYINLEKKRYGSDISILFKTDKNIDCESFIIPAMIIQIPVENALKHAFYNVHENKELNITIKKKDQGIEILIEDNGNGYHPENKITNGTGSGLKFLYQTIKLLNERNSQKIMFSISGKSEAGLRGTIVCIFVPESYTYSI